MIWNAIVKNPRTSWSGLGAIVASLLLAFGLLTIEQAVVIGFAFTGVGCLLAGDAVPAPPNLPGAPK